MPARGGDGMPPVPVELQKVRERYTGLGGKALSDESTLGYRMKDRITMGWMDKYEQYKEIEDRRELSPAELRRKATFEQVAAQLEEQGYTRRDLTVGLVFANVMAIVLSIPFIVLFVGLWLFAHAGHFELGSPGVPMLVLVIVGLFALIFVHEGIHGITWALFAKDHMRSIEFGLIREYMTPYCTSREPLRRWQYVAGALMPCILLGIVPCVVAVATGSLPLLVVGLLMIMAAGGDLTIVGKLLLNRTPSRDVLYLDHPYQAGCVSFER